MLNVDGRRVQAKGYVTDLLTDHVEQFIQERRPASRSSSTSRTRLFTPTSFSATMAASCRYRDSRAASSPRIGIADATRAERCRDAPNAFKPPLGKPALLRRIGDLPPLGPETATTDEEIRGRLEMLLAVDESLGRMLTVLEKLGTLDNTVVVFTSDHGYFYGEHGLNEERRLAYEETIRIPLIVRYPPLRQGRDHAAASSC